MPRILLIHGFCASAKLSIWRAEGKGHNAGFLAFDDLLQNNQAQVFSWGIEQSLSFWQALNPLDYLNLYLLERKKAVSEENLYLLSKKFEEFEPNIVVCHSMGCYLLWHYLSIYQLPKSLHKIVFTQADLNYNFTLPNLEIAELLKTERLVWKNIFCPWDQLLALSCVVNRYLPAGLAKTTEPLIEDYLFPLWGNWNLHDSLLAEERFLQLVLVSELKSRSKTSKS